MDWIIQFFLPIAVSVIMLSIGLRLTLADFKRVFDHPKLFLIGLLCQVVIFPLIAFFVIFLFDMKGALALGLLIIAACPAGNTSCLFTHYARGHVALSVSLTAVNSLLCMFTLPFILYMSEHVISQQNIVYLDIWRIALRAFFTAFLPVMLGLSIHHFKPEFASIMRRPLGSFAVVLLAIIITGAVAAHWVSFVENLWRLGNALLVLFILATGISFIVPMLLGFNVYISKTIAIEVGAQNGAIGIVIASLLTPGFAGFNEYALASALYGVMMYFFIVPCVVLFRFIGRESYV